MYGNGKLTLIWGRARRGKSTFARKLMDKLVQPNADYTTVKINQTKFTVTPSINGQYIALIDRLRTSYEIAYHDVKMLAEELPLEHCLIVGLHECTTISFTDIYHVHYGYGHHKYAHYDISSATTERTYTIFTESDPL